MVTIKQYIGRDGTSPFARWFDGLDDGAAARVLTAIDRIEGGNFSSVQGAGAGVFAISTFDTDYLFIQDAELPRAVAGLRAAGYPVDGFDGGAI